MANAALVVTVTEDVELGRPGDDFAPISKAPVLVQALRVVARALCREGLHFRTSKPLLRRELKEA